MDIVIIGSGNTATVLGQKIYGAGHRIIQVYSRNEAHARALATELSSAYTTDWSAIDRSADLYVLAIPDGAVESVAKEWRLPGRLIVHTAGALPVGTLSPVSEHCGVLYPLQSLRKNLRPFPEIPLLVDARQQPDKMILLEFARTISTQVEEADDETRLKLHLSAVLVNNFSNYLYTLTADYCKQEDLDFSLLLPLIRETALRLASIQPGDAQTGPAIRGDKNTITRHLNLLGKYQDIRDLYNLFTIKIEESRLLNK